MGQMDNTQSIPADRIPQINSRVWFYFAHAFWRKCQIDPANPDATVDIFTGKIEMRCRPACVVAVDVQTTITGAQKKLTHMWLTLDVEFNDDDRLEGHRGMVQRLDRRWYSVPAHPGPSGFGSVGVCWPESMTWTFEPKTD